MEAEPKRARQEAEQGYAVVKNPGLAASTPAAATPSPLAKGGSAGATRHLLVVDDEESVRSLVKMMGEFLGYVVLEAVNGAEALNRLQKKPGGIDVVLTDVNMPVMDGIELVRAMKKMPVPPAIAVMSGRFDPTLRATLLAEGITVLLGKPFSTDELGLTLSQVHVTAR
jgi:two-component system chemotaxis response regulator CheY